MSQITNRHALVIGVADYRYLDPLDGPLSDAPAVAERLRRRCGFTHCVELPAADHGAGTLRSEIEEFLEPLGARDLAVIYFAGHGALDGKGRLRLMPDDARKVTQGIPITDIFDWAADVALFVCVLDCCHAGGIPTGALTLGSAKGRAVLCATGALGTAHEREGRGHLTAALLSVLDGDDPTELHAALDAARLRCDAAGQAAELLERRATEPVELILGEAAADPDVVAPVDPLTAWRALQRALHGHLVPFFDDREGTVLDTRNVVQLDLCPSVGGRWHRGPRADGMPPEEPAALGPHAIDDMPTEALAEAGWSGPTVCTLAELMALPRRDLAHANRWAILGEPGAGKSTLARHLTWHLAAPDPPPEAPVAVFLSLARLISDGREPFELAQADLAAARGALAARGLAAALHRRAASGAPVWLLLDGFDEVPEAEVGAAIERLEGWHASLSGVTLAVFSREIGWARALQVRYRPAAVKALRPAQQQALLRAWLGPTHGDAVWARIDQRRGLAELGRNPLMLTLLAMLSGAGGELPPTRSTLYDAAIDLLLRRGHCARPSRGVRSPTLARRLLAAVSLRLTADGAPAWVEDQLVEVLHDVLDGDNTLERRCARTWTGGVEAMLGDIARNSGIVGPHDGRMERWRYLHRSLRERLAAEALAARGPRLVVRRIAALGVRREGRRGRIDELDDKALGQWGETLGMACGLLPDAVEAVRGLRAVSDRLALRVLGEVDALSAAEVLGCLGEIDRREAGWRGDQLWNGDTLVRVMGDRSDARAVLWAEVKPTSDLDWLAWLHYALTALDGEVDRARFFKACGKWPAPVVAASEWARVPAGSFLMGTSAAGRETIADETFRDSAGRHETQHRVTLTAAYDLARTPVTFAQYRRFDPAHQCPGGRGHPVTRVNWWRARLYAAWLGCRLPTEAEWERACRAGTDTKYWSGDSEADLDRVGWYCNNSEGRTHPVGQKPANPYGLHDMHGNVWECCQDWFAPFDGAPAEDPLGPAAGVNRVLRGGSYDVPAGSARSAYRSRLRPGNRYQWIGFRLARSAPGLDLDHSGRALAGHLSDQ